MVLYLDPYFLGDPLFLPGLARDLAARGEGLVLVHGSGERGERALESMGLFPTATAGVWATDSDEARAAVERATRELNRQIAAELNEAGVASIRATGADRGLIRAGGDGIEAGNVAWLGATVGHGVVAVVAALAGAPVREVDAAAVAGGLARALDVPLVALTTRSVSGDGAVSAHAAAFPDVAAVLRAASGGPVAVGPRATLRTAGGPSLVLTGT
ncbi:hypothetical protein [Rubrivirga sp. IMCC45206]|uniref:hypothetical protein n=1 Tax=Rubrivirga sp. IMCC45206 TaxID=3391614 RepID=UPI00398FE1BF